MKLPIFISFVGFFYNGFLTFEFCIGTFSSMQLFDIFPITERRSSKFALVSIIQIIIATNKLRGLLGAF